jgi:hypothetical protein
MKKQSSPRNQERKNRIIRGEKSYNTTVINSIICHGHNKTLRELVY